MSAPTLGAEFTSGATGGTLPSTLTSTTCRDRRHDDRGEQRRDAQRQPGRLGVDVQHRGLTSAVSATMAAGHSSVGLGFDGLGEHLDPSVLRHDVDRCTDRRRQRRRGRSTRPSRITGTYTGARTSTASTGTATRRRSSSTGPRRPPTPSGRWSSSASVLLDPTNDATPLVVTGLRVGTYAASTTYVSPLIDAGAVVGWDTLTRDVTAPTGTTVTIQVRSGQHLDAWGTRGPAGRRCRRRRTASPVRLDTCSIR